MAVEPNRSEETEYHRLTGFQQDALIVTAGMGQPSGLEIKRELDQYYNEDIYHGRIYPNLDELVMKDLLRKGEKNGRTNWYQTTDRGKAVLAARTRIRGCSDE